MSASLQYLGPAPGPRRVFHYSFCGILVWYILTCLYVTFYFNFDAWMSTDTQTGQASSSSSSRITLPLTSIDPDVHIFARPLHGHSHNPSFDIENIRISFRLHQSTSGNYSNVTSKASAVLPADEFESIPNYKCNDDSGDTAIGKREDLPPSLSEPNTVLKFLATVETDLKILFVGDSIAGQFAQTFDASVVDHLHDIVNYGRQVKRSFYNKGGDHICLSVSAPVRGGGVSSYFRFTDLMSNGNHKKTTYCGASAMKTWGDDVIMDLLNHSWNETGKNIWSNAPSDPTTQGGEAPGKTYRVGSYDAVVMRLPYGWLKLGQVHNKKRIMTQIKLLHQYFGADTVIIQTLPLNNNARSEDQWHEVIQVNEMLRSITTEWDQHQLQLNSNNLNNSDPSLSGPRHILIQEFGNFTNQILWTNAQHLQIYNLSSLPDFTLNNGWEESGKTFLLDRLIDHDNWWIPSIPMVCAQPPIRGSKGGDIDMCTRNKISPDGAHWCTGTIGAAFSASIACLLGCVYNGKYDGGTPQRMANDKKDEKGLGEDMWAIRSCERECNDRFMSLVHLDESWIGDENTIFSKSM